MGREKPKIGVFICHCGANIAPRVDVEAVAEDAGGLDYVEVARDYKFMCSNPGQEMIIREVAEKGLNRVVVASCSPRMHEPTFRKACATAGLNPYVFQMANIREHVSWVTHDTEEATAKAKALVRAAVARVARHKPLEIREVPVHKSVLVIGGGIAGMQAALSAADAGNKVYLVEREPSVGGHMAKFDKTFPTMDCAACTMTPKMVSVGQHENVELITYAELEKLEGFVGNFKAVIRKNARYIDEETCTGCGLCSEHCPVRDITDDFNEGLAERPAVYTPFPQAVPKTPVITKLDRAPCVQTCPAGINVQGYVQLVRAGKYEEAVKLIMERLPLPGVLGRVCPHMCETVCRRADVDEAVSIRELKRFAADQVDFTKLPVPLISEKKKKIAVIGSGPAGLTAAYYLRLWGYKVTIFESLPVLGGMLRVGIPDYRLPPDVLDREIDYILRLGIEVKTETVFGRDVTFDSLKAEGFDAFFLGIGAHAGLDLRIPGEDHTAVLDAVSFLRDVNLGKGKQPGQRVAVVGGGNVAVDAARAARRLGSDVTILYRRTRSEMPAYEEEIEDALQEGIEIKPLITPTGVAAEADRLVGLECLENELGTADASGRKRPVPKAGSEFTFPCDAVITAIGQRVDADWAGDAHGLAWSPRKTFVVDRITMQTSMPGVYAAGDAVTGPATVIEAVGDGYKAALGIDGYLSDRPTEEVRQEYLKAHPFGDDWVPIPKSTPRRDRAHPAHANPDVRKESFDEVVSVLPEGQARDEADRCLNCGGCSECMECERVCETHSIRHEQKESRLELDVGAVVLATGFKAFDPTPLARYGYGRYPEVYTSLEFERLNNATGPTGGQIKMKDGRSPKRVAIVHCVGSRDVNTHKYCSRVCCMYSMKFAHLARERTGAEVWEFYIDLRSPGKLYEEFYNRIQEEGVHFVRGRVAEITDIPDDPADEGMLTVVAENTLTGKPVRLPVDMVLLSVGLEPAEGSDDVARLAGVSRDADGWLSELHVKLAPVATASTGVYLAGCCQGPKDIPDTVAQASAAAGEASALLAKGTVKTRAEISYIDPDRCIGCRQCLELCAYSAITFDERKGVAVVNEAVCQGCGACATACPSSAATIKHFTDRQIMEELEALVG